MRRSIIRVLVSMRACVQLNTLVGVPCCRDNVSVFYGDFSDNLDNGILIVGNIAPAADAGQGLAAEETNFKENADRLYRPVIRSNVEATFHRLHPNPRMNVHIGVQGSKASKPYLECMDLNRAPCILYGVTYIDLVPTSHPFQATTVSTTRNRSVYAQTLSLDLICLLCHEFCMVLNI